MTEAEAAGADIVLAVLRLVSDWDEAEEEVSYRYVDREWNGTESVPVDPHYVVYADCSDTFFWGTADAEPITAETLPIFERTIADLKPGWEDAWKRLKGPEGAERTRLRGEAHAAWMKEHPEQAGDVRAWGESPEFAALRDGDIHPHRFAPVGDLYAARVRGMRPQGAAYKVRYDESLWPLFNECGPEREVGLGNPREPGQ